MQKVLKVLAAEPTDLIIRLLLMLIFKLFILIYFIYYQDVSTSDLNFSLRMTETQSLTQSFTDSLEKIFSCTKSKERKKNRIIKHYF